MATVLGRWNRWHDSGYDAELPLRIRHFVWLSTGMFSAAALAIAFIGYAWSTSLTIASSNFLASIVSGAMFGLSCILKFGPSDA
jgi:hypothetical protein